MQYWRNPTEADCVWIADHMRREDRIEVEAFNHEPYPVLLLGMEHSHICYTLVSPEGEPVAMLGVMDGFSPEFGRIWLLGTPGIEKYGYRFLRYSKQVLQEFYDKTGYEAFYNYTHKDNVVHHKWLKWLGFTFLRRVDFGGSGFLEFVRLKDHGSKRIQDTD